MLRFSAILLSTFLVLLALSSIEPRSQHIEQDVFTAFVPEVNDNALEIIDAAIHEPPPHTEYAKMARYLVHKAEWVSMGSLSTVDTIKGYPMVNIIAAADSARGAKSTGTLYFYLTMLDFTAQDLSKDNRLTVLLSMDQDLDCSKRGIDPMEPTCARIMISGRAIKLAEGSDEFNFGTNAMFSRHPAAKHWLDTHNFFLCKLDIVQIAVLDYYGGPHYVSVDEYMAADPDTPTARLVPIDSIGNEFNHQVIRNSDDDRTVTVKFKKDSQVRRINIEV
ncbi:protein CREG1 isoform X2 [Toxorhynchites rutilus septentrionalis]|nr:protein CREG1 isoform X2 [Toxorhynchites rutilus septentrionalis]XP_055617249.1 protein CREG1 isoform X2 [Toxorhynchites rutilus septentrionalis]